MVVDYEKDQKLSIMTYFLYQLSSNRTRCVRFPVKMFSCHRQFTYLVQSFVSSLIIRIKHMWCGILFGCAFKRPVNIWFSSRSKFAMTLVVSRPGDAFTDLNAKSIFLVKIAINCGRKCVLNLVFDSVNNITHFATSIFI